MISDEKWFELVDLDESQKTQKTVLNDLRFNLDLYISNDLKLAVTDQRLELGLSQMTYDLTWTSLE